MDQVKIGKFIAKLRKDNNMTQEQLGEVLGVTNKTISRWENGNYMPNIEMLQLLSQILNVSINELLLGEYILKDDSNEQANHNLVNKIKESSFSFEEQKIFWTNKWQREHISMFVLLTLINIFAIVFIIIKGKIWCLTIMPLIGLIEYAWQNNKMMIYIENQLYGKNEK